MSFSGWPSANSALDPSWPRSHIADAYPRASPAPKADGLIEPVQPPFPLASSLPFHPDTGSQTSIRISESLLGRNVAWTRQKEGSDGGLLPLRRAGNEKSP